MELFPVICLPVRTTRPPLRGLVKNWGLDVVRALVLLRIVRVEVLVAAEVLAPHEAVLLRFFGVLLSFGGHAVATA